MPRWLAQLRLILRSVFRRTLVDRELDEEFQDHLQREIEAGLNGGLAPGEALYRARRAMGAIAKSKEECRDMRRLNISMTCFAISGMQCGIYAGVLALPRLPF